MTSVRPAAPAPLFDRIQWLDPLSGRRLEPMVMARTPSGVPLCGALRIEGTDAGYPIVDCVARVTAELAERYRPWLEQTSLRPPVAVRDGVDFQRESTVESFGWQWTWNSAMRSELDLQTRVAGRFGVAADFFAGKATLDAGAGAGDQSGYVLRHGGSVVSVDLSSSIDVVAGKLRMNANWVGVQGDVAALPLTSDQFDIVYCEGVIQHTRDSWGTVRELCRVVRPGGCVFASHYVRAVPRTRLRRLIRRARLGYYECLRSRLSRMERFRLLFICGIFAALAHVPVLGRVVRWSGTALWHELMPDFKTTWTNTYDCYGTHTFQRFISPREFVEYFEATRAFDVRRPQPGVVVATKRVPARC